MFRRRRTEVPGLNTTSTADISFMLLIFFLVTTSMDTQQGLLRQLPPPDDPTAMPTLVKERNVLTVELDAAGTLTINGEPATTTELTKRVAQFVAGVGADGTAPEMSTREVHLLGLTTVSDRHVIMVKTDARTTYGAYFRMQDAIIRAYAQLRNQLAIDRFGLPLTRCTQQQRDAVAMVFPQRISETPPTTEGGEP